MKYVLVLLVLVAMAGCAPIMVPVGGASSGPQSQPPSQLPSIPPSESQPRGDIIVPSSPATERASGGAVDSLLADAWHYNRLGEYDRSNAVVERALRINHAEPEIYLIMASNYFAMAQLQLAEQLARQGLPLASGNAGVKRDLQQLLSQIISTK